MTGGCSDPAGRARPERRLGGLVVLAGVIVGVGVTLAVVVGSSDPPPPGTGTGSGVPGPRRVAFDEDALNQTIASQYRAEFGATITVDCPANVEVLTGHTFRCGTDRDGLEIAVEITSDDGDYEWRTT